MKLILKKLPLLTLSLFLVITFQLGAQTTNLKFDEIGLEQGLSQSSVYAITQDSLGFMWFGTQDGLNRYDGYTMTVFKNDPSDSNSISDNTIWSLLCDKSGNLWIGTERGGLNKYVSSENKFYHSKHNQNDSSSLSENFVTSLYEDSRGNIWIGTNSKGLNVIKKGETNFRHFLTEKQKHSITGHNTIRKICEDKNGSLWIATERGCYYIKLDDLTSPVETKSFVHRYDKRTDLIDLSNTSNRTIYCDRDGLIWIGTWGGGIVSLNVSTGNIRSYRDSEKKTGSISGNLITAIYEDVGGLLWIGTYDGGLNTYNRNTNSFNSYLETENVISLHEDKSGILWIGTLANGLKIFDKRKNKFNHYYEDPQKPNTIRGKQILAILMDQDGELWIGTGDKGLNRFNKHRKKIVNYTFDPKNNNSVGSDQIYALCETSSGNIWIGTLVGGLNRFDKKTNRITRFKHDPENPNSILTNNITALHYDKDDNSLLIGYADGGLSLLNLSNNRFKHFKPNENDPKTISGSSVTVIYKGKKSGLWVGTLNRGVNRFITETDSFKKYQVSPELGLSIKSNQQTNTTVNNNGIASIYEDENGLVWMGTFNGGLNRYNPKNEFFTYYTTQNGLPNNVVYGILSDKSGNLWLSTNKGISRFDPMTEKFTNFDVYDGLQSNEFNWGAYFMGKDGEMFFGGVNGFNAFFPEKIGDNEYIPPVYLTTFKVFDEIFSMQNPIPNNSIIELSYSQNFFSFEFVALNYTASEKCQYAYILEGFDNDWHKVSALQRFASYSNLDPGKYLLRIKGSNNDGLWNEAGTSISIIVTPPFWMTWWFRSLGIFLFLSLAFLFYRRRIAILKREKVLQQEISSRLLEKQEEERKRIALEIHDSLGPNLVFIKNRATSAMKKKYDAQIVSESFDQISIAASGVLNTVREISHNLRPPELDQLGLTETLRSILLTARESATIEINGEVENVDGMIPPELEINLVRILQEALSNVLKHSLATKCEIIVKTLGNHIVLNVSDNGKGFDKNNTRDTKTKSGLGLTGMTERVRILGGSFEINSEVEKGTRIEIKIPISHKKK